MDAELARQPFDRDGDVGVADAAEHGLVGLVEAVDDEAGSSACEACSALAELVVVGLRARHDRDAVVRRRVLGRWHRTGVPFGASVSPVCVVASLATAAMSPATTSVSGDLLLAAQVNRPCSRSSRAGALLSRWSSAPIVPESTLNTESWPTNGSAIVLNT